MSEKVKAHHLERGAYVYVRQSTPYQVRNNLESKQHQYALEGRAQQLGFSKVVIIDEDLGRSGSGIQERPGFGRLLASVCQGLAGAPTQIGATNFGATPLLRCNLKCNGLPCFAPEGVLTTHAGSSGLAVHRGRFSGAAEKAWRVDRCGSAGRRSFS
jgi:Resolvase, N terminal domain